MIGVSRLKGEASCYVKKYINLSGTIEDQEVINRFLCKMYRVPDEEGLAQAGVHYYKLVGGWK